MIRRLPWRKVRDYVFRLALGIGWLITVLSYLRLILRSTAVEVMYIRYEPLLQRIFVYDCLTILLLGYWAYLVIRQARIRNPLIPLAIFCFHVIITPYILMGDHVVFLRFRRLLSFQVGYPVALATLVLWSTTFLSRTRGATADWLRGLFQKLALLCRC
jgi:hypothetical protein